MNTAMNGARGRSYEAAVVRHINASHPNMRAHRVTQTTFRDQGDIRFSDVLLQAKTSPAAVVTLGRYIDAAERQAEEYRKAHPSEEPYSIIPAALIKRHDKPSVASDFIVLQVSDFLALLAERDMLSSELRKLDN